MMIFDDAKWVVADGKYDSDGMRSVWFCAGMLRLIMRFASLAAIATFVLWMLA